jgi:hypothetical protein
MRGRRLALAALVVTAAAGAGGPVSAAARTHRLHLPTPPLAHALSVDELEWALRPSKSVVAAGGVRIRVYNRGEDDHDLELVDADGNVNVVVLKPGTTDVMTPRLEPGRYRLFCSLQAGTPESHEARGMVTTLEVR